MSKPTKPKAQYELFAKFFENSSRQALRDLLKNNAGESAHLDFKGEWPAPADLARHILGMASTYGGALVIGVEEHSDKSMHPVGVYEIKDKIQTHQSIIKFLPTDLEGAVEILDFNFPGSEYPVLKGRSFQVVIVHHDDAKGPFVSEADGKDVRRAAIYVRREGGTGEATHDELQRND
jgi:hypothetical protein